MNAVIKTNRGFIWAFIFFRPISFYCFGMRWWRRGQKSSGTGGTGDTGNGSSGEILAYLKANMMDQTFLMASLLHMKMMM
jgi:hypothetical protein